MVSTLIQIAGIVATILSIIEYKNKHTTNSTILFVIALGSLLHFLSVRENETNNTPNNKGTTTILTSDPDTLIIQKPKPVTVVITDAVPNAPPQNEPSSQNQFSGSSHQQEQITAKVSNTVTLNEQVRAECEVKNTGGATFISTVGYQLSLSYRFSDESINAPTKYINIGPNGTANIYGVPVGVYTYQAMNPSGNMFGEARQFDGQFVVERCTTLTYKLE